MTFMAQRFHELDVHATCCTNNARLKHDMITCRFGSRTTARCTRCPQVKGEVAVTAGFVPFKVPGSPVVEKAVFPSPLSPGPPK